MTGPRPHIAFALEYPLGYGGGVSVIVRTLMAVLREEYRLSLVSPDTPEELAASGMAGWLEHHLPWHRERASAARARELAKELSCWGAEIVHFHSGGNFGWGNRRPGTSPWPHLREAGVKSLSTVHLIVSPLADVIAPQSRWWLKAAAGPVAWLGKVQSLRALSAEIAVSEHDAALLRRWYWPYRGRFRRIYHSQLPPEAPVPVPADRREPVVLHAGHRAARKGQDVLLQAFAKVAAEFPEWRLHLVGPPGDETFERGLAGAVESQRLQHRVTIEPSRADAAALMQRAAVYVQPSLHEALGLSLQEALFHGCAAIGTTAGGIPELIDHQRTGLLVPPGSVEAMADALRQLLRDAPLRALFSAAAPASIVARGMTAAAMVQAHRKLYAEILHGH